MEFTRFNELKTNILDFSLSENYLKRSYTKDFNNHINSLFNCESELSDTPEGLISDNYKFSKVRYYEAEANILEKLDDVSPEIESLISNLEDELYSKIETDLGRFNDGTEEIGLIIDNTVHSSLLSIRYNFFTRKDEFLNPWEDTVSILKNENYLYKAIFDSNEFDEVKRLKKSAKRSEILDESEIYVAVKGRNENITWGSFKDFVRLRKVMLDLIEEKVGERNLPVRFEILSSEMNSMNVGLTESEIKSKLIYPLKAIGRIGSCKEGYFLLRTCEDISRSYNSHFSRFRGYFRTLEAHRLVALRSENDNCNNFERHLTR